MLEFIVILLLIYFFRHTIFKVCVYIIHTIFGNFNDSYPVYSKLVIGSTKSEAIILSNEWSRLTDKYTKRMDKQKNKGLKNKELDHDTKYLYKDAWKKYCKSEWLDKQVDFMIEANNAVRQGKKTIKQIKKEFEDKFSAHSYFREAESHYKSWENA